MTACDFRRNNKADFSGTNAKTKQHHYGERLKPCVQFNHDVTSASMLASILYSRLFGRAVD